jgi:predicted phosphodiesterase
MRVLHCTDFHGNTLWFDWLVDQSASYDLVCLTGDHLDLFRLHMLGDQLNMVKAAIRRITTPLALCSGNHDSIGGGRVVDPRLFQAKWLKDVRRPGTWIDGDQFDLSGQNFRCVGWNAPLPTAGSNEIWVFHAPPARSLVSMGIGAGDAGDEIFGEICRSERGPSIVLSGHQHNPARWACRVGRTWCLNPGYNPHADTPNHVVIDMVAPTAVLHTDGRAHDSIRIS